MFSGIIIMKKKFMPYIIMSLTILLTSLSFNTYFFGIESVDGQLQKQHIESDATPIAVVLHINEDKDGDPFFKPSEFTINEGEEVLILNNSTKEHSFTSGESPDEQMAGTKFDTGMIKPGSFAEYLALNLSPGNYTFHSSTEPEKLVGTMTVSSQQ